MTVNAVENELLNHGRGLHPLGDVVKPTRPRIKPSESPDLPFIGMENIEAHSMKLLGTVPASTMKSSAVHFQPGDVLYGRLRPYLNKVYRPDFEGLCSAEFIVFPRTEGVDGRYLQYFLNSSAFVSFASHLNTGDRPRVDFEQLAPYPFPVVPLDEQKLIVAEIEKQFSRLDEAVADLKRVQANLKRYKAAVVKAAVEGRLVETEASIARREGRQYETGEQLLQHILETRRSQWKGKGKYKEPTAPDTTDLPELPDGWAWATLDQLLEFLRNGISTKPDGASGLPILRISAVRPLSVNLEDVRYLDTNAGNYGSYVLAEDDLLFIRYNGNRDLVGVCGVVPELASNVAHPDKLIRCKLVTPGALPDFVAIAVNVGASREYLAKRVRTTAGQAGISGSDLKTMPVPLPPIAEQARIVADTERDLSFVDGLEASVGVQLQRVSGLRQSVLLCAFSE